MLSIPYAPLSLEQEDVEYEHGPDSAARAGVAPGQLVELRIDDPPSYPRTRRRVWLHVPAGLPQGRPLAATLMLDGALYLDPAGPFRAGTVLDNLVAAGALPPMVGIFVDPGVVPAAGGAAEHRNRNVEYDTPDSRFADFLADHVLGLAGEHVRLSDDPRSRLACGGSSGGNGAFTAGWHRPDAFGRVISLGGSFAQIPGGNPYPRLIESTPRKPLRVLLTAAHRDLHWNEPEHNWFAENLLVAAALAKAGYDMRLVLREGGHSMTNGGAILPDALRWAWAR